jgi:hypothetical protein
VLTDAGSQTFGVSSQAIFTVFTHLGSINFKLYLMSMIKSTKNDELGRVVAEEESFVIESSGSKPKP